jgi:glycosyltransferase involved in cell wall biosynthesis
MKPGLCLFTDSLEPSGVGTHMMLLAEELRAEFRIVFACPNNPPGAALLGRTASLGLNTFALSDSPWPLDDDYHRLQNWLREQRIAVFHSHAGIGWEGHEGIHAARAAGVPVVVRTEHLPYLLTDPNQIRDHHDLMPHLDALISVSHAAAASFRAAGIAPELIVAVRNGIRPQRATGTREELRSRLQDELDLPDEANLLLSVGRFTEQKGHLYLLEAMPAVLKTHPQAHCLWAGCGPLEGVLRERGEQLGLDNNIHFLGRRDDVGDLLTVADALVLASLFEGLPLVALEAMASGVPVIGTQVCGTSEAVLDGQTGRLVPPRDANALSAALRELLGDSEMAARWGEAGRKYFEREFSAARMTRETAEVYHNFLRLRAQRNEIDAASASIQRNALFGGDENALRLPRSADRAKSVL